MAEMIKPESVTVGFVALGCSKAIVDSERMLAEIAGAGFVIAGEADNADVVVINTCGFIAPAVNEALEAINHTVDCKAGGTVKKVIVAGCLPERLGTELFEQADGIDAIVGLGQRDSIAGIIEETLRCTESVAYLEPLQRTITNPVADDRARLLITPSHWAYLRISEGCNRSCSFCTIPAIRGRFRSKPEDNILAEAAELVSAGAVELSIIAQDSTSYGQDLKIKDGLSTLVGKLENIADLRWLRLMYLYPAAVTDKLIETVAKSEKIVPYVDIPVQHINNKILKDMRRGHTGESIYRLIERLRLALPDIVLRTTVIVGFPDETDSQFNELLEFVRWARFDALGCFKFYAESGTPAAEMPGQIPEDIKDNRHEELMLAQQEIAFAKNKSRIGTELACLIDSFENDGTARGRFYGQAPDIDSVCIVENCSPAGVPRTTRPGSFINTRVVAAKDYDLVVRQI